ncbi:MAG: M24 family metallopeptidase [Candidatus Nitrosocosmicus sp.]
MLNNRKIKTFENLDEKYRESENKVAVLFKPENIFYLTGFWGEGISVVSEDEGKNSQTTNLLVPKLEYSRALNNSSECNVISSDRGTALINGLMSLIKDNDCVFSDNNDFDIITKMQAKIGNKNIIADNNLLYDTRQIKDKIEIENIIKASKIIDKLFEITKEELKENITEEHLQSILVFEAMKQGARFPPYIYTSNPLIIASGPNGSFPHAETSSKKIRSGEFIVIDITLSYNHYVSDATRTFAVGQVTEDMTETYQTVKIAQQNGIEYIKKTKDFKDIDFCCRDYINSKKMGEYFTHSTGHGIGLEVHEPPWIRPGVHSEIKESMTITVEPGIYIENRFGVRIEDSLLITKKKTEVGEEEEADNKPFDYINLHSFSKELLVL